MICPHYLTMAVMAVYYISCLVLLLQVESSTAFTANVPPTKSGSGIQHSHPSSLPVTTSPSSVQVTTTAVPNPSTSSEPSPDAINQNLPPFHQIWWPVCGLNTLDTTTSKPNGLHNLGKYFMALWNQPDSAWTILDG